MDSPVHYTIGSHVRLCLSNLSTTWVPARCNVGLELKGLKQLTLTMMIIIPGDGDSRDAWCQGCCLEACIDCSSSGCPLLHHTSTLRTLWTGVLVHCTGLVQGNIGMCKWGCVCVCCLVSPTFCRGSCWILSILVRVRASIEMEWPQLWCHLPDRSGMCGCDGSRAVVKATYIHTHIHACMHTYIHTYTYIQTHIHIHAYIHTCIHAYTHSYIHTYIHIHAYANLYMQTYMYTHLPLQATYP